MRAEHLRASLAQMVRGDFVSNTQPPISRCSFGLGSRSPCEPSRVERAILGNAMLHGATHHRRDRTMPRSASSPVAVAPDTGSESALVRKAAHLNARFPGCPEMRSPRHCCLIRFRALPGGIRRFLGLGSRSAEVAQHALFRREGLLCTSIDHGSDVSLEFPNVTGSWRGMAPLVTLKLRIAWLHLSLFVPVPRQEEEFVPYHELKE
jgi:hypothetical protein